VGEKERGVRIEKKKIERRKKKGLPRRGSFIKHHSSHSLCNRSGGERGCHKKKSRAEGERATVLEKYRQCALMEFLGSGKHEKRAKEGKGIRGE